MSVCHLDLLQAHLVHPAAIAAAAAAAAAARGGCRRRSPRIDSDGSGAGRVHQVVEGPRLRVRRQRIMNGQHLTDMIRPL